MKNKTPKKLVESKYRTKIKDGKRLMICQNSVPGGKWWKGIDCDEWVAVGEYATAVLCYRCVNQHVEPPMERGAMNRSGHPKGWKFMKVYVAQDGTVFHKGIEQPDLKGTLPVTIIEPKPEKKKLSKQEKESEMLALGKEIKSLKAALIVETRKGKRAEFTRALAKANRAMKKLM
jgi:predicted acylesterase/phospholipase RssA